MTHYDVYMYCLYNKYQLNQYNCLYLSEHKKNHLTPFNYTQ